MLDKSLHSRRASSTTSSFVSSVASTTAGSISDSIIAAISSPPSVYKPRKALSTARRMAASVDRRCLRSSCWVLLHNFGDARHLLNDRRQGSHVLRTRWSYENTSSVKNRRLATCWMIAGIRALNTEVSAKYAVSCSAAAAAAATSSLASTVCASDIRRTTSNEASRSEVTTPSKGDRRTVEDDDTNAVRIDTMELVARGKVKSTMLLNF
mmetsp:Transcript_67817/g.78824  ORF Transcript_67817/g.78824 Transcript_67817/m.78824 type:complete len:210 (+) Transcript_67817:1-630(+)